MCVTNEEPLQYVANQNIHVGRHLYILSVDKTIDLPYDLICLHDITLMLATYHFCLGQVDA